MDIQCYKAVGYTEVSANFPQALIDRAEQEVTMAYIEPILPEYASDDEDIRAAIMALAVLRMQQLSVFATRSGAKEKTTAESYTASRDSILLQYMRVCNLHLQKLRKKEGAISCAKVDDICGIYFISNYFFD